MHTKLIQQYGEDILCYRLRTARQRKRMQYKDFDKQLIQLHKKENELYRQHRNLGWEPLLPPVQKGWIRHFVLRDDVAKSRYGEFFEAILKKINTYEYDWKKDFKRKKRKRGRKIYVVKPQYLLRPYEYQFQRIEFTEIERQFFTEVWEMDSKRQLFKRYEFTEPWRFVLRIRANMIDRIRIKDALLESEIRVLINYLERNDLRGKQTKLLYGNWKRWSTNKEFKKYNEINRYKNKSLIQILDLLKCE